MGLQISRLIGFFLLLLAFQPALPQQTAPASAVSRNAFDENPGVKLENAMTEAVDAFEHGNIELANSLWISALALSIKQSRRDLTLEVLARLSVLERRRSNHGDALQYLLQQLDLLKKSPELGKLWLVQGEIAALFEQLELFNEARQYFVLAVDSANSSATPVDIARAQVQFAGFLNDQGLADSIEVDKLLDSATPVIERSGTVMNLASAYLQRGRWFFKQMDDLKAADFYNKALRLAQTENNFAMIAHVNFRRGELALSLGDLGLALTHTQAALASYETLNSKHRLVKVFAQLERIYLAMGQELDAARAGREHYKMRQEILFTASRPQFASQITALGVGQSSAADQALQAANALAQQRLRLERRFLVAIGIAASVLTLMLISLFRRQRIALKLHRELTQAHEALKAKSAETYHASITDALTGMFNRRFGLSELASKLLHRDGTLSVTVVDVDNFKSINDRYGHPIGDEVLRSISQTLLSSTPSDAMLARLGGEEFLLLLPDRDAQESEILLESLRRNIASQSIWTPSGPLSVTICLGERFILRDENISSEQAYSEADQALYEAKALGKNCWKRWHEKRNDAAAVLHSV